MLILLHTTVLVRIICIFISISYVSVYKFWFATYSIGCCQILIQYANWTQYNGHTIRKFKPKLSMRVIIPNNFVNHSFVVFAGFS